MTWWGLFYAVTAGLLNSVTPSIFKMQGAAEDRQMGLQLGGLLAAIVLVAAIVLGGRLAPGGWPFLLLGGVFGALNMTNVLAYYSVVVHRGPVSISWSVVWMASVIVSVMGWVLLGEPVRLYQPIGLICFLGCLVTLGLASHRMAERAGGEAAIARGYWLWLAVALAAGAGAAFLTRLKESLPGQRGHDLAFLLVGYLVSLAMVVAFCAARSIRPPRDGRTVGLSLVFAAFQVAILASILRGVRHAGLSDFYPVLGGLTIVCGVAWAVIRGERPSWLVYAGALLAVLSIVLINLGGPVLAGR